MQISDPFGIRDRLTIAIDSPSGTRARAKWLDSGYPHHAECARKHLKQNAIYTVDRTEIDDWHTDVYLKEIPGIAFNHVHFEKEKTPQYLDYIFFDENRTKCIREHPEEFVVIKNKEFLGFFNNENDAILETLSNHKLGTFIVQKCVSKEEETITIFNSGVSFVQ